MPLPLIAAGIALAAAGGAGAAGGGHGILSMRRAKRSVEEKQKKLAEVERVSAGRRGECESAFRDLGEAKLRAIEFGLVPFHAAFEQLKNVELETDVESEGAPAIDEVKVAEAGKLTLQTVDVLTGSSLAAAAGAGAFGATTAGVTMFASASTGAAISGLSGVAATNAGLAWLGGGTLAAGGGGVVAGTAVLTGIAAAPALLVGGALLFKKGREAVAKSEEFAADVDAAIARHRSSQAILKAATQLSAGVRRVIERCIPQLARESAWLDGVVAEETDWTRLGEETQERIRGLVAVAMATSDLVHTPVVGDDGLLTSAIQHAYRHGKSIVGSLA